MSEWQPIETAPKDGSMVLAVRGGKVEVCRYISKAANGPYWNCATESRLTVYERADPPTHWMPLPEPPK